MKIDRLLFNTASGTYLDEQLSELRNLPQADLSIAFGSVQAIQALSKSRNTSLISEHMVATSSCQTAFSDQSYNDTNQLTLLRLADARGNYGVASRVSTPETVIIDAKSALLEALEISGKSGEVPDLIWCSQSPGLEEGLLAGIYEILGNSVPVFGGTSADDEITGNWCCFDGKQLISSGFVIAVLFSSAPISFYFSSGYESTPFSAKVTKVEGRKLICLDNQPAALVYNKWRAQFGAQELVSGSVLASSTFTPLGRVTTQNGVNMALLSHPAFVDNDGCIELFSEVETGDIITFMHGDASLMIERAGTVSSIAKNQLNALHDSPPQAAIIIFCAGCMLAINKEIQFVHQHILTALGETPFIGAYTFGEQGQFADGINRHGNLMISAIIFGHCDE